MQQMTRHKEAVDLWRGLSKHISDMRELLDLVEADDNAGMAEELDRDIEKVEGELEDLEFRLGFSGPHDFGNAILSIHAGAGGTESQDWASMLLRMYLRWAESHGFETEMLESMPGEEAGIKSATVSVVGEYAFGYLKSERGVHRLVRLSPFDAAHRRHTSFVLVEVVPDIEDEIEVQINPDDLKIDTFCAGGHGGQNVQKNATAIRITHVPSGIIASCQNERSLAQNRAMAMKVLRGRLFAMEDAKREEERARLKGKHVSAGWGNQIRSYVLHPYHMVKDLRTDYEVGNTDAVLDGNLDSFMQAYLKSMVGEAQV
jgi:peptide chain release factor 2